MEEIKRVQAVGAPFALVPSDARILEMNVFALEARIKEQAKPEPAIFLRLESSDKRGDFESSRLSGEAGYGVRPAECSLVRVGYRRG